MNLFGAGLADHLDQFFRGRAADNRIIDHHHALVFEHPAHRIELHADIEIADMLVRIDEGPADIMIADQADFKRDAGFFGIAEGGGVGRVGNTDDDVSVDRMLLGQLPSEAAADLVDIFAEDL